HGNLVRESPCEYFAENLKHRKYDQVLSILPRGGQPTVAEASCMYYAPPSLFRKPPWVGRAVRTLPAPHGGQCRQSGSTNLLVGCGVRTCARTDPKSVALTVEPT